MSRPVLFELLDTQAYEDEKIQLSLLEEVEVPAHILSIANLYNHPDSCLKNILTYSDYDIGSLYPFNCVKGFEVVSMTPISLKLNLEDLPNKNPRATIRIIFENPNQ